MGKAEESHRLDPLSAFPPNDGHCRDSGSYHFNEY